MKVFVWKYIEHASGNWHPEGGVVVFAKSLKRAVELANEQGVVFGEDESPTEVRECMGDQEVAYVFPDAGCC